MKLEYQENIKPLTPYEEEVITRIVGLIDSAMQKSEGRPNRVTMGSQLVSRIEEVILSDPGRFARELAERAGCSLSMIKRHRARLREEGKIE